MGELVHESEVSHIIAVPRSRLQPTGPLSAAALEQLAWRLPPEKQVPGQHKRASAPQELGTAPGFAPGWLGIGSYVRGSWGRGARMVQGAGYTGFGVGAGLWAACGEVGLHV